MTGKKEAGISWRHTSVIVRADIFSKAHEEGIDISNVCNKALADLLGMDYRRQQFDAIPLTSPVIIAQNNPPAGGKEHAHVAHTTSHLPVINADDPEASLTVRNAKREPKPRPAPKEMDQVTGGNLKKEEAGISQEEKPAPADKGKKPAAAKAKKDDGLKRFVSTKITRSDAGDANISKDDMYQAFCRFCREDKVTKIPDRKAFTIALKNKFAFFDKTLNGIPSWVNVRLK